MTDKNNIKDNIYNYPARFEKKKKNNTFLIIRLFKRSIYLITSNIYRYREEEYTE